MLAPLVGHLGITVYGCEPDEQARFDDLSSRFGVVPTMVDDATVPGDRCVSVSHRTRVTAPMLRAWRDAGVEYVGSRSCGVDHVDVQAADELGITVEGVGYAPDGVADFTLLLILLSIRGATPIIDAARRHDFRLPAARGRDLCDLTVGVVGVGSIGTAVIRRLRGFGCRVLASTSVPFDELLRESDVVTLHLPLNAATHHLIGAPQLAAMKPGAVLVNTGRGGLVDTGALLTALGDGRLGGAALDVVEGEEGVFYVDRRATPVDDPALLQLLARPDVVVTPHTAYFTERSLHDTVERTLVNCLAYERNRANGNTRTHDGRDPVRGVLRGA